MNRPVPMAPPSPIITIWDLLRPRCRPCSRSLIGFGCMRFPSRDSTTAVPPAVRTGACFTSGPPGPTLMESILSELARHGKADGARLHGQQSIRILRRVDSRDLRTLVGQVACEGGHAPQILDQAQSQVYQGVGGQLDVLVNHGRDREQ